MTWWRSVASFPGGTRTQRSEKLKAIRRAVRTPRRPIEIAQLTGIEYSTIRPYLMLEKYRGHIWRRDDGRYQLRPDLPEGVET